MMFLRLRLTSASVHTRTLAQKQNHFKLAQIGWQPTEQHYYRKFQQGQERLIAALGKKNNLHKQNYSACKGELHAVGFTTIICFSFDLISQMSFFCQLMSSLGCAHFPLT